MIGNLQDVIGHREVLGLPRVEAERAVLRAVQAQEQQMRAQLRQKIQEKEDCIKAAINRVRWEQARRAVHHIRCTRCVEEDGRCTWEVLEDEYNTPCTRCKAYQMQCTIIRSAPDSAGGHSSEEKEDKDMNMEDDDDAWRKLSGCDAELWRANAILAAISGMLEAMDCHLEYLPSVAPLLASSPMALATTPPPNEPSSDLDLVDWLPATQMRENLAELQIEYRQYIDDMEKVDIPVFLIDSDMMDQGGEQRVEGKISDDD